MAKITIRKLSSTAVQVSGEWLQDALLDVRDNAEKNRYERARKRILWNQDFSQSCQDDNISMDEVEKEIKRLQDA